MTELDDHIDKYIIEQVLQLPHSARTDTSLLISALLII